MKRIHFLIMATAAALCLALVFYVARSRLQPHDIRPETTVTTSASDFRLIAFEDIHFQEPMVRDRLARTQAEANAIATPAWQSVPWHWQGAAGGNPPTHFIFAAQWCSRPRNKTNCSCSRDTNPCHMIDLVASPRDMKAGQPKEVYAWSLIVNDYPADQGWGVRMSYGENWFEGRQHQEHFTVDLHAKRWSRLEPSGPTLRLPCGSYEVGHKFGDVEYRFLANLEIPRFNQARSYVSSPEGLAETIIGTQDALEVMLGDRIDAGLATLVLDHAKMVSSPPTRNPPEWGPPQPAQFTPPIPAEYALTAEQKQAIKEQLAEELEQRRELARTRAGEIHAAIGKAFPLGKLLAEFDARPAS